MLKIHTSDGKTHRIDLTDEAQSKEWLPRLKTHKFQASITGISVVQDCQGRVRCPSCKRTGHLVCESCGRAVPHDCYTRTGVQYSLSRPDGFDPVFYVVEHIEPEEGAKIRGGERITCFAGDSRIAMMVHKGQPSTRVTLLKTGRQSYNPYSE